MHCQYFSSSRGFRGRRGYCDSSDFYLPYVVFCCLPQSAFESKEQELKEINVNKHSLKKNLLDLRELHHILQKTLVFFTEAGQGAMRTQGAMETGEEGKGAGGMLACGV